MRSVRAGSVASVVAMMWASQALAQGGVTTDASGQPIAPQPSPVQQEYGVASSTAGNAAQGAAPAGTPADADAGDAIVVSGIRASLATALTAKKIAPNIQEVLSAEDIGKLPDNNIADSLARLPGISTNRDRGNPTTISIRGLPAELTNTLLNGREMVTGDADRNIRYDQYPAELITGAAVYKSPTAAQVEGAIAGQVDLKTIRPLDYKKPQLVLNGRAEYDDASKKVQDAHSVGWIASASYVGQFADDTLGVAFGVSGRNEPVATQRTNIYRYTNSFADLNGDGTGNDNIPYGFEALQRGGTDKRIGGLGTIQWRPGNGLEITADGFYSRIRYTEYQRGFSVQGLPFGNSFGPATVTDGGAVAGSATNFADYGIQLENNNQLYTFTDTLYAGGLNAKYDADRFHVVGDFGYSTVTRHAMFLNEYTEAVNADGSTNTNGVTVNWLSRPGSPSLFSFNQPLTDQSRNLLTNLEIPSNGGGAPIIHDTLYSGRGDVGYDVDSPWLKSLKAGVRVTSRSKDFTQRTQFGSIATADRAPLPDSLLLSPVTWGGQYAGLPSSLAWDVRGVADQYFGGIHPMESVDDMRSSWEVAEKTYGGYVQADFSHDFAGEMSLTGNLGVRIVRTEETSRGTQINQSSSTGIEVPTPVVYHNNFTDVLPELNATLHIDSHQQVRFAVSKAVARAPLDFLNAGFAIFGTASPPAAFGGNPALKPYRADQVDLTYEHYFNRDTAATVSLFYKKLDSFVVQQITTFTTNVNGFAQEATFQQPVNGSGGSIKGVELLYQQAFTFLPKPLDGLGVYANFSYTDSSVHVAEADNAIGNAIPLPGLSKYVYNLSLYYSKYGVDARVGYRYRSSFATQTGDTDRILYNHGEGVLTAQVSYEFPEKSPLAGLTLRVQGDNLTNTPYQLYYGDTALQGRYETFGRRFYAGATYRF